MIKKIISGGQTGADIAALDAAIKLNIPHGGWIPKGRKTETGRLDDKYQLQEMDTPSYPKRTVQNIIDSDGTLIISNGELTNGSAYTREMASVHQKPWLHIDLNHLSKFDAAMKICEWLLKNRVEIVNVAGSRGSKDLEIYQAVKDILESAYYLNLTGDETDSLLQIPPVSVEEAANRLAIEMTLKDRSILANMSKSQLHLLHSGLGLFIEDRLEEWSVNPALMESCEKYAKKEALSKSDAAGVVLDQLWEHLRKTHRLRVIK